MDSSVACWAPGRGDYTGPTEEGRDGAWPFRDGVELRSKRPVGALRAAFLDGQGQSLAECWMVAIPPCAAIPGGGGQRASGLLVLASCFFQGTPGRFLILGARFSLKWGDLVSAFLALCILWVLGILMARRNARAVSAWGLKCTVCYLKCSI